MFEQLIQLITQKVGIGEQEAKQALNAAINFIREHVPAIAPYLGMLGGGSTSTTTTTTPTINTMGGGNPGDIIGQVSNVLNGSQRQQLQQQVQQAANLNEHQANGVVDTITGFITQHLGTMNFLGGQGTGTQPAGAGGSDLLSEAEHILGGQASGTQQTSGGDNLLGEAENALGGLFGGNK